MITHNRLSRKLGHYCFLACIIFLSLNYFLLFNSCQKDEFEQQLSLNEGDFLSAESVKKAKLTGKVRDVDGNYYKTVKIGTQWWMAENLKTTRYANKNPISNVTDNGLWQSITYGAWRYYDDNVQNNDLYGKLYNWQAVSDPRNLCPKGWHVPSDNEWKTLELYLGMNPSELDLTNFRGSEANVGGKLKRVDSELWSDPNEGATNESGFSAIPGGRYNHDGTFIFLYLEGTWWSSTLAFPNTNLAWLRILTYYHNGSYRTEPLGHMMGGGFSVRCIKDN